MTVARTEHLALVTGAHTGGEPSGTLGCRHASWGNLSYCTFPNCNRSRSPRHQVYDSTCHGAEWAIDPFCLNPFAFFRGL